MCSEAARRRKLRAALRAKRFMDMPYTESGERVPLARWQSPSTHMCNSAESRASGCGCENCRLPACVWRAAVRGPLPIGSLGRSTSRLRDVARRACGSRVALIDWCP
eukprot:4919000-Prymnesium_polylepis.2